MNEWFILLKNLYIVNGVLKQRSLSIKKFTISAVKKISTQTRAAFVVVFQEEPFGACANSTSWQIQAAL